MIVSFSKEQLAQAGPDDLSDALERGNVVQFPECPIDLPPGCAFASRCPVAIPSCRTARPPATPLGEAHSAACIRIAEGANVLTS